MTQIIYTYTNNQYSRRGSPNSTTTSGPKTPRLKRAPTPPRPGLAGWASRLTTGRCSSCSNAKPNATSSGSSFAMICNYCEEPSVGLVLTVYGKEPLCSSHQKGAEAAARHEHTASTPPAFLDVVKMQPPMHRNVQIKEITPTKWAVRDLTYRTKREYTSAEDALMAVIRQDETWAENGIHLVSKVTWAPRSVIGKAAVEYLKEGGLA